MNISKTRCIGQSFTLVNCKLLEMQYEENDKFEENQQRITIHNVTWPLLIWSISPTYINQVAKTKPTSRLMNLPPKKMKKILQLKPPLCGITSISIIMSFVNKSTWRTLRSIKLRSFPITLETCWQSAPSLLVKSPTVSLSKNDISYNKGTTKWVKPYTKRRK